MSTQEKSTEDLSAIDDPDFLAERRRIRDELERSPDGAPGHADLAARYDLLTAEFIRRARVAWPAPETKKSS